MNKLILLLEQRGESHRYSLIDIMTHLYKMTKYIVHRLHSGQLTQTLVELSKLRCSYFPVQYSHNALVS